MPRAINILPVVLMLAAWTCATAQSPIQQAQELFDKGLYDEAAPKLKELRNADPKNNRVAYMLGVALSDDNPADAHLLLEQAIKGGIPEASLAMADLNLKRYDTQSAQADVDRYRRLLGRKTDKIDQVSLTDIESRIERTEQMLERVEKIEVVDSITVNADDFFKAYALAPSAGSVAPMSSLPKGMKGADDGTVYRTEDTQTLIWAAPDSDGNYRLVTSTRLTDGTWETPTPLGDDLSGGGDANYPFLLTDGVTLYFANDGDDSLGGYDIFITRNDGSRYLQPQNIGMPFNSPYDDYLLAIDEENNLGWWATDRNRIPGKVTIYLFRPSETRRNYPADTPGIADLALLTSIADTWQGDGAPSQPLTSIRSEKTNAYAGPAFNFALPDGRIITSISELRSSGAIDAMGQWLHVNDEIASTLNQLETNRSDYAAGHTQVGQQILNLEKRLMSQRAEALRLSNEVVRLESRAN